MLNEKEMTAVNASVAPEARQSSQPINSITETGEKIRSFDEDFEAYQREIRRMMDPSYLKTVTMPDLYNTVFERQSTLIEGFVTEHPSTGLITIDTLKRIRTALTSAVTWAITTAWQGSKQ